MKHRILLAEDDLLLGPVIEEMLHDGGYDVVLTRDLADVVRLEDFAFTAVVSDYRLLHSDGCDVIGFMRSKVPGIPALLISGYGLRVADVCAEHGIKDVGFMAKPFTPTQLAEKVAAMFAAPVSANPFS
jgi:DNA-binding NtrC family response regulator